MPNLPSKRLPVLLFLAASAIVGAARAESPDVRNVVPKVEEMPDLRHTAPSGFVLVEEGLWAQHNDQPGIEFVAARDSVLQANLPAAAVAIRRAAAYVRAEASRADGTFKPRLQKVSVALMQLADDLGRNPDLASDPLGPVFAEAQHVLALHHIALARESVNEEDARRAGEHMAAAALNVRGALAWADRPLDRKTSDALDRVAALAAQLQDEGATVGPGAQAALKDLEQALAL